MARNVTDAAVLLGVLAGRDPDDAATVDADTNVSDYLAALDPGALEGARIGVWREGVFGIDPRVDAVMEATAARLEELGATIVDPADLALEGLGDNEFPALLSEFKARSRSTSATLGPDTPKTLQDLIDFNLANADTEMALYKQETFDAAQAAPDATDPVVPRSARRTRPRSPATALDDTFAEHDLDADHHARAATSPGSPTRSPATRRPASSAGPRRQSAATRASRCRPGT